MPFCSSCLSCSLPSILLRNGSFPHCRQARISQDTEHFLLNPFGMLYHEVTASSLVKVDMQGNIVETGSTNFGVSVAGFMLHSAIHSARPDIKCVIHLHHPAVVAVSGCCHPSLNVDV